jgi:hypothetical protein
VSPRAALIVGAIQSFVFGVPLVLFPAMVLAISGLTLPDTGAAIARGAGATVIGLGIIDLMLRDITGTALRGLIVGNLAVQALSLVVNGGEVLAGHLPVQAAGASPLHLALSLMFLLALRTAAR